MDKNTKSEILMGRSCDYKAMKLLKEWDEQHSGELY